MGTYVLILVHTLAQRVRTDAPQPRAMTYVRKFVAGLGRPSPRKRSFAIERIYAYIYMRIKP